MSGALLNHRQRKSRKPARLAMLASEDPWIDRVRARAASKAESPVVLDALVRGGEIDRRQFITGMRLLWIFERAGLHEVRGKPLSVLLGDIGIRPALGPIRTSDDALASWRTAMAIVTPIAVDVVYATACLGEAPGSPVRMEILRRALDYLADRHKDWSGLGLWRHDQDSDVVMSEPAEGQPGAAA